MRVVILTNCQGNQIALANKIAAKADVAGIVFSKNIPRRRPGLSKRLSLSANGLANRTIGRAFIRTWFELLDNYHVQFPSPPSSEIINVDNVNDPPTVELISRVKPDLVVVSGTNLVGRKVIEAANASAGIINLHTGISPYVKGGPNCTNWCLAKNWFHLIGNTVMWLDTGIDSGNLIATEQTQLTGRETLFELHWKVMEHGQQLYADVIEQLAMGNSLASIPQSTIKSGKQFNSVDWNFYEIKNALHNFQHRYRKYFSERDNDLTMRQGIQLFPLHNV